MIVIMNQAPMAVLADIHGNALALSAVVSDARQRGVTNFVNLGDIFYGPLDPVGTWDILRTMDMPTVLGNQDRILFENTPERMADPVFRNCTDALGDDAMNWLGTLPDVLRLDDILLCHGTPGSDTRYLLEDIATGLPAMRDCADILDDALPAALDCTLVLAGHSHHPGLANCDGLTMVNPGSVGLPAYDDDTPPHIMASGSPHAKYAVVERTASGWEADFISVEYDWTAASDMARRNGRENWAEWLLSGMA